MGTGKWTLELLASSPEPRAHNSPLSAGSWSGTEPPLRPTGEFTNGRAILGVLKPNKGFGSQISPADGSSLLLGCVILPTSAHS